MTLMALMTVPALAEPDFPALARQAESLLGDYVRLATTNPPADTGQAADLLSRLLQAEGIEVRRIEGAPGKVNLVARLAGKSQKGSVMLLHHMDVVPADAARWPVDPFSGQVKDGYLHGRGSVDMKGLGVLQLLTFIAIKREGLPLEHDLVLLASADEESGGEFGARYLLEHHPDVVKADYVLDEGGFGTRDLLSDSGRLIYGISVAEKKILWCRLKTTGTAGHGSQPQGDNPNDRLMEALRRLQTLGGNAEGSPLLSEIATRVGPLSSNPFTGAIARDTMSVTSLRSGVGDPPKVNVVPSLAEATVDIRLLPDTSMDAFLEQVNALLSDLEGVEFEIIYAMGETPVSPWETPLFQALEKALKEEHSGAVVTPYLVPFGTDSNSFRRKGALAYGFHPMVLDRSIVASMHSDNERLPVAQLEPGLRIFYRALKGYLSPSER